MNWQVMTYEELIEAAGVGVVTPSTYLYVDKNGDVTHMEKGGAWDVPHDEAEPIGYALQLRGI
jgi:hypothetical protein